MFSKPGDRPSERMAEGIRCALLGPGPCPALRAQSLCSPLCGWSAQAPTFQVSLHLQSRLWVSLTSGSSSSGSWASRAPPLPEAPRAKAIHYSLKGSIFCSVLPRPLWSGLRRCPEVHGPYRPRKWQTRSCWLACTRP